MNIKIIEPCSFDKRYEFRSLTPNLGPITIASLLKAEGHDCQVISEYVTKMNLAEVKESDVVGISITTYNANRGFEIARMVEKPIVFGGFHASLMPEECLQHGDYVIRGDGYPVVELVRALENGNTKDLSRVPNLVYKKNGRIVYNQQTSQIIDIAPDFGLVKDYYRLTLNRLIRIPLLVNGSRGCHLDCTFCAIKEVYRDVKKRRPSEIIEDIKSQISNEHFLSRFFPRVMWITDDNFFSDREWAKEVLRNLATIKTKYVFVLQARVELGHDDEMLDLLRKANIGRVYIGIESLRDESLHSMKKGIKVKDIKDSIRKIKKYGIDVHGLFVFGDDEFRKGDWLGVANFVKENGLSGLLIQPLTPFPGTKLFKKLKREGRILHENWSEYNGKVVFKPRRLTPAELQEEIYKCYNAVYGFSHVFKYMFKGRKGLRLGLLGEAIIRRREWIRMRRYIKERLMEKNAVPLL